MQRLCFFVVSGFFCVLVSFGLLYKLSIVIFFAIWYTLISNMENLEMFGNNSKLHAPLADRMRPSLLNDFIGQEHVIYKNSFLFRAIVSGTLGSCIFFGPPGTGKTTLGNIIANTVNANFRVLNAVSSGVADAKKVIEEAKANLQLYGKKTYLYLDECHRWSKSQSDSVLGAIEDGTITFIGSTTENPYTNMTRALVSRCKIFEFKSLTTVQVKKGLERAIADKVHGYGSLELNVTKEAMDHIAWFSAGDLRSAYNSLELAVLTTPPNENGVIEITREVAEECLQEKAYGVDETQFYDLLSAFGKSIRGSDADAALYYSNRMIIAGVDPKIVARRLIAHASEDIGMADSNAVLLATTALTAIEKLGMPECNLVLSHAIVYACEAPKSNSVYMAMNQAKEDAANFKDAAIPNHIKNHPTGYGDQDTKYKYAHSYEGGYSHQQYLPKELKNKVYYVPSKNGREASIVRKKLQEK